VKNQRPSGLTIFDTLLVCILATGMMAVFMTYYGRMVQEAKETALKTSLASIRLSIHLYHTLNGRYPKDLEELLTKRFLVPTKEGTIFSGQYLKAQTLDSYGHLIDSFGQQYQYNPAGGKVSSGTVGYENW
jgi:type II secretory pathway pseudopilin PulG